MDTATTQIWPQEGNLVSPGDVISPPPWLGCSPPEKFHCPSFKRYVRMCVCECVHIYTNTKKYVCVVYSHDPITPTCISVSSSGDAVPVHGHDRHSCTHASHNQEHPTHNDRSGRRMAAARSRRPAARVDLPQSSGPSTCMAQSHHMAGAWEQQGTQTETETETVDRDRDRDCGRDRERDS